MKKYQIIILIIFLISFLPAHAKRMFPEAEYQTYWCNKYNGILEYQLNDKTRVDCLTDKYAVEFDFANKWAECIGQSLYYGLMTGKDPACVLIMERGKKDYKYLKRLRSVGHKKGIRTYIIKPYALKSY